MIASNMYRSVKMAEPRASVDLPATDAHVYAALAGGASARPPTASGPSAAAPRFRHSSCS
jgi:hypothetical protein